MHLETRVAQCQWWIGAHGGAVHDTTSLLRARVCNDTRGRIHVLFEHGAARSTDRVGHDCCGYTHLALGNAVVLGL